MHDQTPSLTAEIVAAHRAVESSREAGMRLCCDPLARSFLSPRVGVLGRSIIPERLAVWIYETLFPGNHTYLAIRTKYLDDCLRSCLEEGLEQLVILGAGYDSRPYRFESLKDRVRVFEVDHPATQKAKLCKLKGLFGSVPQHVSYVSVDFVKERLEERLFQCGYDRNLKTLFLWEGVTYYITADAVDKTLDFVAHNSGKGSSIVFDYTYSTVVNGTCRLKGAKILTTILKIMGEPFRFGIEIGEVGHFLARRGFHKINDATYHHFKKAYLTGMNGNRCLTAIFGIVQAFVT